MSESVSSTDYSVEFQSAFESFSAASSMMRAYLAASQPDDIKRKFNAEPVSGDLSKEVYFYLARQRFWHYVSVTGSQEGFTDLVAQAAQDLSERVTAGQAPLLRLPPELKLMLENGDISQHEWQQQLEFYFDEPVQAGLGKTNRYR